MEMPPHPVLQSLMKSYLCLDEQAGNKKTRFSSFCIFSTLIHLTVGDFARQYNEPAARVCAIISADVEGSLGMIVGACGRGIIGFGNASRAARNARFWN